MAKKFIDRREYVNLGQASLDVIDSINQLKDLCKQELWTLYLSGTNSQGHLIYKIKEAPTFRATFYTTGV